MENANNVVMSHEVPLVNEPKTEWTSFTYKIPPKELQKFKTCKVGAYFKSKRFKSDHGMECHLQICPNGRIKEEEGYCVVYLYLESKPKEYGAVFVHYMLRCDQIHAAHQCITRYDGCAGVGWFEGVPTLSELSKLQNISFSTKFRILRIEYKSGKSPYYYPLNTSNLREQERFQWDIDQELLQKMKTALFGQRFCRLDVLSDSGMYSLFLYPNGRFRHPVWIEGKVVIGLNICALPNGVHEMKLKWKIEILELKKEESWTRTFSYDVSNRGNIICDKEDLESLTKMTILVTVDILECHSDSKGTVIQNVQYKSSVHRVNDDDEKREDMNPGTL